MPQQWCIRTSALSHILCRVKSIFKVFLLAEVVVLVILATFMHGHSIIQSIPYGTLKGLDISCQQPFVDITDDAVLELSLKLSPDPYIPPREAWLKPEAGMRTSLSSHLKYEFSLFLSFEHLSNYL